jgi:hypothetical protein
MDDKERSFLTVEGFIGSYKKEIRPFFEFGITIFRPVIPNPSIRGCSLP